MGTQLIFTVGTNPLPVWVAWHHLKDKLPSPVQVRFVHTKGTIPERERLEEYCKDKDAEFLNPIQTSAGNPKTVRGDIRVILNDLRNDTNFLHVHYTGGTKVMGVETVAALEASLPKGIRLDTSYLDARASSGPAIVNRAGNYWVDDARKGIDPDLCQIARLNGFTIAPFEYQYWSKEEKRLVTDKCPAPGEPTSAKLEQGMDALCRGCWATSIEDRADQLEYGAYDAFQKALNRFRRTNYQLFHDVNARRAGATKPQIRHFQLDVVAVLGYQIVVVSCTTDTAPSMAKQKAMEAYHRARQLGGDEARAVVLCGTHPKQADLIKAELQDETGSSDLPLQVWGTNTWKNLSRRFEQYLRNDLNWQ